MSSLMLFSYPAYIPKCDDTWLHHPPLMTGAPSSGRWVVRIWVYFFRKLAHLERKTRRPDMDNLSLPTTGKKISLLPRGNSFSGPYYLLVVF